MTAIIEARNLTKVFPVRTADGGSEDFTAVDDLSFSVAAGESLAIVGESGSGKTTTARMVAGLEVPTAGTITVEGEPRPPAPWPRSRRRRFARQIQMVYQDPMASLDPRQSVGNALEEAVRFHYPMPADDRTHRVRELLEQVGLHERHRAMKPRELSGGQRQRVAIARALAVRPKALILDEAVSALDVSVQAQVLNLLADLRAELGISYLFISHDLAVVRQVCDRCVVMLKGRVVEAGQTETVLADPQHDYTRELLSAIPGPGWKPARRRSPASSTASGRA
ncbi:ABC transporter ATP-binding protein [Streptomyces canus]|uniref:ABC transporter ATP-binding protein n=1 Tax=Streptomyces canus TaxID=58343 RepID=UPI003713CF39